MAPTQPSLGRVSRKEKMSQVQQHSMDGQAKITANARRNWGFMKFCSLREGKHYGICHHFPNEEPI